MNTLHLTEEQLDDILLGDANGAVLAHYEDCAECHARADEMTSAIHSFTTVTMEWSERRSSTMPPPPVTDGSPWGHKLNWALGAAVIALAVVAVPFANKTSPNGSKAASAGQAQAATPHPTQSAPSIMAEAPTLSAPTLRPVHTTQVEQDNRMLQAISEELDASVASPTETFGVEAPQGGGRSRQHDMPAILFD